MTGAAKLGLRRTVADFISLMKPRIIVLLLISTVCPMIVASAGRVDLGLVLWTLLGGTLMSGSASALNCVWDKDIDRVMERTKNRPLAADRISTISAVVFALLIGFGGMLALALKVNPLSAALALGGHLFYVLVYTMWLKRSTPQNIVIGGAAGAVPPLVGWAAVTGTVDLAAVLMFLVVFLWTPPHFWALALNKNADYQRAGVPMLPVVAGEHTTHMQILVYALTLIPISVLLVISSPNLGMFSLVVMTSLSLTFVFKTYQLKRLGDVNSPLKTKKAWDVFAFSLVYLALFFVCMVVDAFAF